MLAIVKLVNFGCRTIQIYLEIHTIKFILQNLAVVATVLIH